jgi:hypothetical protein
MPSLTKSVGYSANSYTGDAPFLKDADRAALARRVQTLEVFGAAAAVQPPQPQLKPKAKIVALRVVKVLIADTEENLPLHSRLLHSSPEKVTDATDQELYFELPMQELLTKHNEIRIKTRNKQASERAGKDIMLEPIRVRDLKMVIVDIASF